ncbi:YchJ family protein [Streptomyces sp. NPDC087420]|uniref:YchJ family protein n=1 Tax=Streptomyces sp. NPDC087420 TaxID=3365785 RepID=UPI003837460C
MARRPHRQARPARTTPASSPVSPSTASPCPCGRPASYGECCGRYHVGPATAPTAEALMRSRYSAFVVLDASYLLRTWDPATRPNGLELDPTTRWTGLDILETTDGTPFHTTGTVTFRASYTQQGHPGALHERSRFTRHDGAWVYVDGTYLD